MRINKVTATLQSHQAEVVRRTKHIIWKLPNGRIFVQPGTPSDWRAEKNQLSVIRRLVQGN